MKLVKTLYKKSKTDKILEWNIYVDGDDIVTIYGEMDGKKQEARKKAEPTNVGRSNERNAEQQALFEAESMAAHKKTASKYFESIEEAKKEEPLMPMLAVSYEKVKKKVSFPITCQYKLDGLRCLAYLEDGEVVLQSRGNKQYNIPHIKEELAKFFAKNPNVILDGEIYKHNLTFQEITTRAKKIRPETVELEYHVYDTIIEDSSWMLRSLKLDDYRKSFHSKIVKFLESQYVETEGSLETVHKKALEAGYEGLILRVSSGKYEVGHRSSNLIKVKSFLDAEYKIVGITDGSGKASECIIYICQDDKTGKTFHVVPACSLEQRNLDYTKYKTNPPLGRKLTVKYFELTDEGLPRFPVGVGLRPEEDIDEGTT